jgi:hypothetical protein
MTPLVARGLSVDLQILDNEASAAYKHTITFTWQAKFQLVPPGMHCQNRAEQAIRTFKAHFLSILVGVDPTFPPYLWDLLLPQAELTLNLLQQSALNPQISTWEFFQGPVDFNKTPLGPVGCRVLIHAKPATRCSWDFRAKEGYYIGQALDSYRCFRLVKSVTKSQVIMVSTSCWAPSRMLRLLQASPRWKPLPIYEICLNHGAASVLLLQPTTPACPPDV